MRCGFYFMQKRKKCRDDGMSAVATESDVKEAVATLPLRPPPSELRTVFWSFLKVGAVLFGGGYTMLPLVENEIVTRRKWCTADEIYDIFAISQLIPGVVAVNAAMLLGHRLHGRRGAFTAAAGLLGVPCLVILAYAAAFDYFRESHWLQNATVGLRPAVAGMLLGVAYTLFTHARKTRLGLVVSLAAAALVLGFGLGAVTVILAGMGCGIVWHLIARRHAPGAEGGPGA